VSGHPRQSDESFISIGPVSRLFECSSALSRAQIEAQATNIHTKLIGSMAAINLLRGEPALDIVTIIHVQFESRQPE
jgi:hypothetical protein